MSLRLICYQFVDVIGEQKFKIIFSFRVTGACVERFGPPKLVQDRCFQFDGDSDVASMDKDHKTSDQKEQYPVDSNISKINPQQNRAIPIDM